MQPIVSSQEKILGALLCQNFQGCPSQNDLELAKNFATIAGLSLEQARQTQKQTELKSQVREAWEASTELLPNPDRSWKNYNFCSVLIPAQTAAGDCLDYFQVDEKNLAFFIADATGKGVGPCLEVSTCRAYFRALMTAGHELDFAVTKINQLLCRDLSGSRFITAWFGLLNERTHELRFVNAGHSLAFRIGPRTEAFKGEVGLPLGLFEDSSYCNQHTSLAQDVGIALLTDGWTERPLPNGRQYGARKLILDLQDYGETARETLERLFQRFEVDCYPTPKEDDLSALILQHQPRNAS